MGCNDFQIDTVYDKRIINTNGINIAIINSDELIIKDTQSALDLMAAIYYNDNCQRIAINKEAIIESFFDLNTGIAGELLQKFSNYKVKIAIIGDFSAYTSKPLKDYIHECNQGNTAFFVPDEQTATHKLISESTTKIPIWEQVLEILNDQTIFGYMATVEDGMPRVRPMGFMFEDGGKLYFCVTTDKNVYKQLCAMPFIEYSKTTPSAVWVRVRGEIKFDDDIKKKERIFENHPELKLAYQTPDNPLFKVFYMEHGEVILSDFVQGWRSCYF